MCNEVSMSEEITTKELAVFMGSVQENIKTLFTGISRLESKIDEHNTQMDKTVELMHRIVENCRENERQENIFRDRRLDNLDGKDGKICKLDARVDMIENKLSWYAGALALLGVAVALIKELYPFQVK